MTTYATDDTAQLFDNPDLEHVGFAQGVIRAWDRDTFENVVDVRGGRLTNLPVAAGVEALTYSAGNVVMLSRWKLRSGKGSASYWIGMGGRVIFPGGGAAESTIAFMRGELAKQIIDDLVAELLVSEAGQDLAAFVLGQRVHGASAAALVSTSSTSYVSLAGDPEVTDVPISDAGVAIVGVQSRGVISPQAIGSPNFGASAWMSYDISGATTRSANDDKAYELDYVDLDANSFIGAAAMAFNIETGLNPGTHTFSARYRAGFDTAEFELRRILVMAL